MDESRRRILMEELEEAVAQRDDLHAYIEVLAKRLGIDPPPLANASGLLSERGRVGSPTDDPDAAVAEGQFYGKSAPKAAKELLAMFGSSRPMKTDEIFKAITKGGVSIGTSGTLYRSLFRDPEFHKVGRGLWGLAEWYSNAAKRKTVVAADHSTNGTDQPSPGDEQTE
jgi:hypothetical protein